jgi:DNA-binding transcriptional regulator YiaG
MGKVESTIKAEILRLAKREVRSTFVPLRREVRTMRLRLSGLSKGINSLNRTAKELHLEEAKPKLEATPEEIKASRLTPDRIRRLRAKLGISQRELGILTGATIGAVLSWEKGKFKPKGEKKATLVALRKLRKRDVRKILTEKAESEVPTTKKSPKAKTGRKRPSKRVSRRRK